MVRTANQFLCGCPILFGVVLIIFANLVHNVFYLVTVSLNIIFKIPTVGANDPPAAQVFNAAWCLLGMPFIFAALWGMWAKQESNMRLYLLYLCTTFVLDFVFVFNFLFTTDICGSMPRSLQRHGSAFACGFVRFSSVGLIVMGMILFAYCAFIIWSYCEDLKAGGGGKGLDQLMQYQEQQKLESGYNSFVSSVGAVGNAVAQNVATNNNKYQNLGGGQRMKLGQYRGVYHETSFPPPAGGGPGKRG